ncbi:hypothetical protein GQ44DRAFT_776349 [Phaeosphaeriaceae sp. PMI808]|nr:hypothetical protein GQ44DRAFT_776349 [Phaeosphaeriaceae sp. PMI808]
MAGILVIGIGLGAEKLGRKISEKRLERKEKKAIEQREAIYGYAEASSASTEQSKKQTRKIKDPQQEQEKAERRHSASSDRTLLPAEPPPPYEEVVRHDVSRG